MRQDPDDRCVRIASHQRGLVTLAQTREAGVSRGGIQRRVDSGRWVRILPGVYAVAQALDPWLQKLEAARLWTGDAVIMGHAAAELWGLDGIQPGAVEIGTVTRKRHPDVVVHHGVSFPDEDLVRQRGLPTTTPTRTLIDISGCVSVALPTQALDSAMRRGLTHIPRIRERLSYIGTQGRAGTRTLQRLLTDRELGSGLTESPLEVRVERALHRARLDPPERQFTITCPDGLRIRLDFAWPEQRVGIEADWFRWHTDFEQWLQDARKHNLLQEMGWRIVRATHRSLHENPDALPRQVASLLGQTRLTLEV
jgi:very-short-patch-repair endonuclease